MGGALMGVYEMMAALQELEQSLEIELSNHQPLKVKRAYNVRPAQSKVLADLPCFMNVYDDFTDLDGIGSVKEGAHSIQVDFFAHSADSDVAEEIALKFWDVTRRAFLAQKVAGHRFNETVDYFNLRAERPAVATLEWGGLGYPGFRFYLDITSFEDVNG